MKQEIICSMRAQMAPSQAAQDSLRARLAEERPVRKKNRSRWGVLAACAALVAAGIWGAPGLGQPLPTQPWTAQTSPPALTVPRADIRALLPDVAGFQNQELRFTILPVGDRAAEYHMVELDDSGDPLAGLLGEPFALEGWYRPAGHDELQYLISREADGTYLLWEFSSFVVWSEEERAEALHAAEEGTSAWVGQPWFRPDLDASPYSYGEVLEQVYGVTSADALTSVTVSPANMDNTAPGKALQAEIGTTTLTGREALDTLYGVLTGLTCTGDSNWEQIGLPADLLEAVRVGRYLSIQAGDTVIDGLKYTAAAGQFYEYGGISYAPLGAADAAAVSTLMGIG